MNQMIVLATDFNQVIVFGLDGMAEKRRFMDFEDKKKKYKGRKDK